VILEYSYNFFVHPLHPDNFSPTYPMIFLVSLLDSIMRYACYERPILCSTFSLPWQEFMQLHHLPPVPSAIQQPTGHLPFTSVHSQQVEGGITDDNKLGHIHPIIQGVMRRNHANFADRVEIHRLLEAANITFWDLSCLTHLMDQQSSKNWLCYNHCPGH
jgi:hypothetical protein